MYKRSYINLGRITQNSQILITYVSRKSIARVSPKVSQVALCPTREIYDVLGYYKKLVVGSAYHDFASQSNGNPPLPQCVNIESLLSVEF